MTDTNQLEELKRLAEALLFNGRHAAETGDEAATRRICERRAASVAITLLISQAQTASDLAGEVERLRGALTDISEATAAPGAPHPLANAAAMFEHLKEFARAALKSKEG